jgi:hypothetical protein
MLRPLLLAGAVIVAVPASAQTAGDHDPTVETDAAARARHDSVSAQVNGGVNTATTGAHAEASLQAGTETNLDHNDAPGFTGTGGPYEPAAKVYPPCSRTVTDRCLQTHERRRRR